MPTGITDREESEPMALNWNVEDILDHDTVCFYEAPEDSPMQGVSKGDRVMNPVTNVLIWATVAVDLGSITPENAAEFYARLRLAERLDGPFLIRAEVDGKRPEGSAAWITPEEVEAHVGLKTNVSNKSRTAWLNRLKHSLDGDLNRYADQFDRETAARSAS